MNPEAGRIATLDGLRGIAILLVVALHVTMYAGVPARSGLDGFVHRIAAAGWIGVDLFFVLSGFLITGILLDARGRRGTLRAFWARRVLRIFPLYYAALLAVLVLLPALVPGSATLAALQEEGAWYWSYLLNVRIALDGWPEPGLLGHFWSLAVEEQFYLLWPFAALFLSRRGLVRLCSGAAILAPALRALLHAADAAPAAFVLMPARADALALGGALAIALRPAGEASPSRALRRFRRAGAVAAVGLVGVAAARGGLPAEDPLVSVLGHSLLALAFTGLLAASLEAPAGGWGSRLLAAPGLVRVGRRSYAMYVVHHPLVLAAPAFATWGAWPPLLGSRLPGWALFVVATAAVSFALAEVSWRCLEAPCLALRHRFPYGGGEAAVEGRSGARAAPRDLRPAPRGR